jgi:ubiquinone/menaquinone biosynthesis C-methylase UbiE
MIPSLAKRRREDEWMDAAGVDPAQLRRSLRFIRRVNTLLGYTRATLWHLKQFSRRWKPGERITMIDFATGSADIPRAILRWATKRNLDVRVVGVDRHPITAAQAAAAGAADPRLQIVQANVLDLPFAPGTFDYALTAMFLHHLDDADVVRVLSAMGRVARRGVVAADLLRHRRAYAWISAFTLLANPMVKHDARVSVAQAFTKSEILDLRDGAGISFARYHRHFGHRFVLAGEKDTRARPIAR